MVSEEMDSSTRGLEHFVQLPVPPHPLPRQCLQGLLARLGLLAADTSDVTEDAALGVDSQVPFRVRYAAR